MTINLMKERAADNFVRAQFVLADLRLFDVDLVPGSHHCVEAPGLATICTGRSKRGVPLPSGWAVNGDTSTNDVTLAAEESVLYLAMKTREAAAESGSVMSENLRAMPLGLIKETAVSTAKPILKMMSGRWLDIIGNEGFEVKDQAPEHDECRSITCNPGYECFAGVEGQGSCYPSLFGVKSASHADVDTPEERTWLQQMVRLARSPYADSAMTMEWYEEDGWTVHERFCLQHTSNSVLLGDKLGRQDCAIVHTKKVYRYEGGDDVAATAPADLCSISFEGSDDSMEIWDVGSYGFHGTAVVEGYHVWRGVAREYARYVQSPSFQAWRDMATDPTKCSQVYITGHSVGGAVAQLHRMELETGRLVIFSPPPLFTPFSYPKTCRGEMFHSYEDPVKLLPAGFIFGGVQSLSVCGEPQGLIQDHGCNSGFFGVTDFCDAATWHKIGYLREQFDVHNKRPPESAGNPAVWGVDADGAYTSDVIQFGQCRDQHTFEWVQKCVERKCIDGDSRNSRQSAECAMGPEALKAAMTLEDTRRKTMARVASAELPEFRELSSIMEKVTSTPLTAYELPGDLSDSKFLTENSNLCPADVLQVPGTTTRKQRAECVVLDEKAFFVVEVSPKVDDNIFEAKFSLYLDILKSDADLKTATSALVANAALVGDSGELLVQLYPAGFEMLKVQYRLQPGQLVCKRVETQGRACLVYGKANGASEHSVDLVIFVGSESDTEGGAVENVAYQVPLGVIGSSSSAETDKAVVLADALTVQKTFGSVESLFLAKARGYEDVADNGELATTRTLADAREKINREAAARTSTEYCAKTIVGQFCRYSESEDAEDGSLSMAAANECPTWRNAVCLPGGYCGCRPGQCASDAGICVDASAPGGMRSVGNECAAGDESTFIPFVFRQDPSHGAPYDRCVILSDRSYIRMDYPDPLSIGAVKEVAMNALMNVVFTGIPFSFRREVTSSLKLVQDNAEVAVQGIAEPDILLEVRDRVTEGVGEFRTLLSRRLSIDVDDVACADLDTSTTEGDALPVAEACLRHRVESSSVDPIEGGNRRSLRVLSEEADSNGEPGVVSQTVVEEIQHSVVEASMCVPVLFPQCKVVPIASIRKKTTKTRRVLRSRRLQDADTSNELQQEVEAQAADAADTLDEAIANADATGAAAVNDAVEGVVSSEEEEESETVLNEETVQVEYEVEAKPPPAGVDVPETPRLSGKWREVIGFAEIVYFGGFLLFFWLLFVNRLATLENLFCFGSSSDKEELLQDRATVGADGKVVKVSANKRASAVEIAMREKFAAQVYSQKEIIGVVSCCATMIPENKWVRRSLGLAFPLHFSRMFLSFS
jgi:hypothetical protein